MLITIKGKTWHYLITPSTKSIGNVANGEQIRQNLNLCCNNYFN